MSCQIIRDAALNIEEKTEPMMRLSHSEELSKIYPLFLITNSFSRSYPKEATIQKLFTPIRPGAH